MGQDAGVKVGEYELLEQLGRGGAGVVFCARGPDGRMVALKLLTRTDRAGQARFDQERALGAGLGETAGFVPVLDAGESARGAWLVMPLLMGTLRDRLRRGPLEVEAAVALGRELALALGRAHALGIVHRDLKPENVLFAPDGRALVADLGLAKHYGPGVSMGLSVTGQMRGTAGYMAPEQMADAKRAGPPADVFAVGAILFECLCGRPAFPGDGVQEVLRRVAEGRYESLRAARPDVPAWLQGVIEQALSLDPERRFMDGHALARALVAPAPVSPGGQRAPAYMLLGALLVALGMVAGATAWAGLRRAAPPTAAKPPSPSAAAKPPSPNAAQKPPSPNAAQPAAPATGATSPAQADPGATEQGQPAPAQITATVEPTARAEALLRRGVDRLRKGDARGALKDLELASRLGPELGPVWGALAEARLMAGDPQGAVRDASRALELDPDRAEIHALRGEGRSRVRDLAGAEQDLARAVELDPEKARWWSLLGAARWELEDMTGSDRAFQRSAELAPQDPRAWINMGAVANKLDQLDRALAAYERALELDPSQGRVWCSRGQVLRRKGDPEGAIASYERGLELDPSFSMGWNNLGNLRLERGELPVALGHLDRALELDPQNAIAWATRSEAKVGLGDLPGAIADLERCLALRPGGEVEREAREELESLRAR